MTQSNGFWQQQIPQRTPFLKKVLFSVTMRETNSSDLSRPLAVLLNETEPGSVGTLDSSICCEKALDRYTSTACYHRKVTSSLDSCHWLSKESSTCCRLPVCVSTCVPGSTVTNESQTHVNTHFTRITPSRQSEHSASATGDALTCPCTILSKYQRRKSPQVPQPSLFPSLLGPKVRIRRVCYPPDAR